MTKVSDMISACGNWTLDYAVPVFFLLVFWLGCLAIVAIIVFGAVELAK